MKPILEPIVEKTHLITNSDTNETALLRTEEEAFQSDEWLFRDPQTNEFFRRKLSDSEINNHWKQYFKQYIRYKFGGFKGDERYLSASPSQTTTNLSTPLSFLKWASIHHPNSYLSDFTREDVHNYVRTLFEERNAFATMVAKTLILRETYHAYCHKHLADGLKFRLDYFTSQYPKPNSILKTLCDEYGIDFAEWGSGGTHGSIPIYTAMGLLAYAVRDLRNDKTRFAVGLYGLMRKYDGLMSKDHTYIVINDCFSHYSAYRRSGKPDIHAFIKPKADTHSALLKYYYNCKAQGKEFIAGDAYDAVSKQYNSPNCIQKRIDRYSKYWDWYWDIFHDFNALADQYLTEEKSWGDVSLHVKKTVRYAAFTITLCLTGSRSWSEIRNMRNKDVVADDENPEGVLYTTPIKKTNFGIEEVRVTHNLVLEAAHTLKLCRLNLDDNIYLFSRSFLTLKSGRYNNLDTLKPLCSRALRDGLLEYYAYFIKAHPELGDAHPHINAHQFRHTWAEFALRMFEGNVTEEIRRHFMHSYGSYMTQAYTFDKLKDEIADNLVREYLKEILGRIVDEKLKANIDEEFQKDLQGIAVDHLTRRMNNFVITPDSLDEFLDNIADEYVHIKAHEYGYCLSRVATLKHSNCYDNEKGMPDYDGACFQTCIGCVSFCASKKNNEAALVRQAIAHTEFAKNRIEMFNLTEDDKLVKQSLKAVEEGNVILDKWKIAS